MGIKPKFSVIIPLFNKEKEIGATLESVLGQIFTDFELIIVDDGSTDNSLKEVEKHMDNRIRVFSILNCGVSNARNVGIKNSKGDYIAFLDGDDIWHSHFLFEINKLIELNPECKIFGSEYTYEQSELNSLPKNNVKNIIIKDYFRKAKFRPLLTSSSVVISRECINDNIILFNTQYTSAEDLDVWARLFKKYKRICFTTQILACYFLDANNRASNKTVDLTKTQTFFLKFEENQANDERQYNIYRISSLLWMHLKLGNFLNCYFILKKYPYKFSIVYTMIKHFLILRKKRKRVSHRQYN